MTHIIKHYLTKVFKGWKLLPYLTQELEKKFWLPTSLVNIENLTMVIDVKKSQDYVKIVGFYRPSHSRPILTPGIQICSQKWSQVNISIGYSYISQVKILYKVKFSKLEICQSDCRFKILAKNCVKKVSFFFQNFD